MGFALVPRTPIHSVQIPANATSGRVSSRANHFGVFFGLVSAYSQNDVNGTKQRLSGPSHRRQCGDLVLRIFVVMPGNCGGLGMPHRIIVSSRSPSLTRTTGATWSGKIAGSRGRLPVVSLLTLNRSRMAFWFVVMEYRLHIDN